MDSLTSSAAQEKSPACWCGNADLEPFSPDYVRCNRCQTLILKHMPGPEISTVRDDEIDFYGREYWFSKQVQNLGYPDILERARADLPERCLHWLNTLLKYKVPPGRVLELGGAHGGFVAILRWAGFDATGLELSPWVVQFARETFQIPVLLGPLEQQTIEPQSLDVIALMDVLEHLPDPAGTMRRCLELLKADGLLLIQTPRYPEGVAFEEMTAAGSPFLEQLRAEQHLMLFSRTGVTALFKELGADHVQFERALFSQYDMFLVVSRGPLRLTSHEEITAALTAAPAARLIGALLDLRAMNEKTNEKLSAAEADRAARLSVIEEQGRQFGEVEAERNRIRDELRNSEEDRAARLRVIEEQGRLLGETEAERNDLRYQLSDLTNSFKTSEDDRAARLKVIEEQARLLAETEAERNELRCQLSNLMSSYQASEDDRAARLRVIEEQARLLGEKEAEFRAFQHSWRRFLPARK